jgi:hypothetical protein
MRQYDVKTAYLHGEIDKEIYVKVPEDPRSLVTRVEKQKQTNGPIYWKLKKGLYGLKQAGRVWNKTLTKHLKNLGLEQSKYDHSLFYKHTIGSAFLFLLTYVDDIMVVTNNQQLEYDIINGL